MHALTVAPGTAGSTQVEEVPDPTRGSDELLVAGIALGVCGTDREIAGGRYGWAPPGRDRLTIGHESLGRVLEAPEGGGFEKDDLVVGVVRRPDPEPCPACARGEWDMCRNGRYTERGIKSIDGYASTRWTVPTGYAVKLPVELGRTGVLTEPTSVVAKAWEQVEAVGSRAYFDPRRVLITGAGPVGLLAAMIGVQRGLDVHVLDQMTDGPKPALVEALGATYHATSIAEVAEHARPDVVIEATGVGRLVFDAMGATDPYGIVCLTGVSSGGRTIPLDMGATNRRLVLENEVIIGSVNANLRDYRKAVEALAKADRSWLDRLITTTVPLEGAAGVFDLPTTDEVKVIVDLQAPAS